LSCVGGSDFSRLAVSLLLTVLCLLDASGMLPSRQRSLWMLGTTVVLAVFWNGVAFMAPLPACRDGGITAAAYGCAPTQSVAQPQGNTVLPIGAAAVVVAALVLRSRQRSSIARNQAVQDEADVVRTGRTSRPKGPQNLPGKFAQRLFSTRNRQFWDHVVHPRTYFFRRWKNKDIGYAVFLSAIHIGAIAAPFFFTWKAFATFCIGYIITGCFGITLSYHRQLAHLSFKSPKPLEYLFAYCGALALQSHPINWVSSHRHHHAGCETEKDVHSPLDGFWWSHAGWLLDADGTSIRQIKSNANDLRKQWFYQHMQKYYVLHAIVLPIAGLYAYGGLPCVLWGFFARVVWVWHITWAVNSVSHVWGFKDWNTKDNSMNNWMIGILAFGEGWHNNHHAFETSCRHGLKWWQVDMTWYMIKTLSFFGLANHLKYPSKSKQRILSFDRLDDPRRDERMTTLGPAPV